MWARERSEGERCREREDGIGRAGGRDRESETERYNASKEVGESEARDGVRQTERENLDAVDQPNASAVANRYNPLQSNLDAVDQPRV